MSLFNGKIFSKNRKYAFILGLISTVIWWFMTILQTQDKIRIKQRHLMGLGLAFIGFIIWFLEFSYTVESS